MWQIIISVFLGLALVILALAFIASRVTLEVRVPPKSGDIVVKLGRKKNEEVT